MGSEGEIIKENENQVIRDTKSPLYFLPKIKINYRLNLVWVNYLDRRLELCRGAEHSRRTVK